MTINLVFYNYSIQLSCATINWSKLKFSLTLRRWSSSLCSTMLTWVRWRRTASRCWWATLPTSWTSAVTLMSASCTVSASSARIQPSWSRASTLHRKVRRTAVKFVTWIEVNWVQRRTYGLSIHSAALWKTLKPQIICDVNNSKNKYKSFKLHRSTLNQLSYFKCIV